MAAEDSAFSSLSDNELRDQIQLFELEIAGCAARIDTDADERKRSRRLARGTFLTAAGFFGLALDPISAIVAVVGFFDWIEALRDDAAQTHARTILNQQLVLLKARLASLQTEVRRRSGRDGL